MQTMSTVTSRIGSMETLMLMNAPHPLFISGCILCWHGSGIFLTSCKITISNGLMLIRKETHPFLAVIKVDKRIAAFPTQCHGVTSSVRRPLTTGEYEQVMEAYWRAENRELGLCGAALTSFQLSMIGCQDDISKWRLPDLQPYKPFSSFWVHHYFLHDQHYQ